MSARLEIEEEVAARVELCHDDVIRGVFEEVKEQHFRSFDGTCNCEYCLALRRLIFFSGMLRRYRKRLNSKHPGRVNDQRTYDLQEIINRYKRQKSQIK